MNITQSQVSAALRHVGTSAATGITILAVLGILSPDQVQQLTGAIHDTMDGLNQATAGISKILLILGPVAGVWFAKAAASYASLKSQLKAVAASPEVKQVIVATPAVAEAIPNEKVVAK